MYFNNGDNFNEKNIVNSSEVIKLECKLLKRKWKSIQKLTYAGKEDQSLVYIRKRKYTLDFI